MKNNSLTYSLTYSLPYPLTCLVQRDQQTGSIALEATRCLHLCLLFCMLQLGSLCTSCTREVEDKRSGALTLSLEQHSAWVRLFNPFSPNARRFTRAGIYEPLLIRNSITGEYTPWLATRYQWNALYTELTFEIRPNVKFSDGEPLSALDVVYSFELLKEHPALDTQGLWRVVKRVYVSAPMQVTLELNEPNKPKLDDIAHHPIIPRHIWRDIKDPVTFTNPTPVATGPFTEMITFRSQLYELGRNPHYWRSGQPKLEVLRFPAFPSNDQANLALVTGEVDWAGNFIPAIERTFVAADPEHHMYWFPLVGSVVNLIPNTHHAVLSDPRVRKALSRAINRERLVEVAMYGYTRPADSTGLSDGFSRERDPRVAQDHPWTEHNPKLAEKLLREAGLTKTGGVWRRGDAQSEPLTLTIEVVSGWSDWVRAAQVIAGDLRSIGIQARVKTREFSAWFDRLGSGQFELAIGWADDRGSLYHYYKWLMSEQTVKPIGETAAGNFHRLGDPKADQWLARLKGGATPAEERALNQKLQRRYAELAPVIPLFPNPQWGAASTKRARGFPTASSPYAPLSPNREPECLLVLTQLTPVTQPDTSVQTEGDQTEGDHTEIDQTEGGAP